MLKKINLLVNLLFLLILFYLAYQFIQLQNLNLKVLEKSNLLNKAADDFINIGFYISILIWILSNINVVKTKQKWWLLAPLLFTIFVSLVMSWQAECIFIFNKQNGLWKGGFSLSYFFGLAIIFFAVIIFTINYYIVKSFLNNNMSIKIDK